MPDDSKGFYNIILDDVDELRAHIFGLAIECPMGGSYSDCHLYNIQAMSIEHKFDWVNNLSHEVCIKIYKKHKKCLTIKESPFQMPQI